MGLSRGWRSRYLFFVPLFLFLPFILSVSRLHQNSIPQQEPTRRPSKKSDHLVLGPAAGQGLPNRLQCQGLKAANKIHMRSNSQNLQSSDFVSFVTVHTIYNSSLKLDSTCMDVMNVGNISYSKAERSMAILNTFINFIQVSMPRSSVIILTDPASEFSLNRNNAAVVRIQGDYSRGKLMLQRIRSYIMDYMALMFHSLYVSLSNFGASAECSKDDILPLHSLDPYINKYPIFIYGIMLRHHTYPMHISAFLETRLTEHLGRLNSFNHYVFTDSDIAVVDDIGHIFQRYPEFHLALTFRNNKDQPLNSGFIAVRGTPDGIYKAKAFLQEVLDVYSSRYIKASRMLGDQLALAWVVKSHLPFSAKKFARHQAFSGEINGASVLFLPCAVYNWTPPEGAGQFHGMPLDVQIVHFKGSRKRLMLESWNFLNSTSNVADMLCLILKSGRTKYDF